MSNVLLPFKCSSFEAIDYDEEARILTVLFRGGTRWLYRNVSRETFGGIVAAAEPKKAKGKK